MPYRKLLQTSVSGLTFVNSVENIPVYSRAVFLAIDTSCQYGGK